LASNFYLTEGSRKGSVHSGDGNRNLFLDSGTSTP